MPLSSLTLLGLWRGEDCSGELMLLARSRFETVPDVVVKGLGRTWEEAPMAYMSPMEKMGISLTWCMALTKATAHLTLVMRETPKSTAQRRIWYLLYVKDGRGVRSERERGVLMERERGV